MTPFPNVEEMQDILDIKDIPMTHLGWLVTLFGSLLIILLLWWGFYLYQKKKNLSSRNIISRTPLQIALDRLDVLVSQGYGEAEQIRLFYFSLSEIFRQFLERELEIPASEATLEELIPLLEQERIFTKDEIREAAGVLEIADLAKFARRIPDAESIQRSSEVCRALMTGLAKRRALALAGAQLESTGALPIKGESS